MLRTVLLFTAVTWCRAQTASDHDYVIPEFTFKSGEGLKNLRLHYTTLGSPQRDAAGHVRNVIVASCTRAWSRHSQSGGS